MYYNVNISFRKRGVINEKVLSILTIILATTILGGCTEAERVSSNLSQEADNFNVLRRLTVLNARTDKPMFELIGAFSIKVDNEDKQLEVTVEMEDGTYKKYFVNLNEYTMYVVEDLGGAKVNKYKYEVNFLPETIQPIDIVTKD